MQQVCPWNTVVISSSSVSVRQKRKKKEKKPQNWCSHISKPFFHFSKKGGEFVFEPVVQHRIRRKPVQLNSSHPSSQPTTMTNINPNKLSRRPTGSLFQSQLLINLSNRVNGLDSPTTTSFGSTASTSTHLTHSTTSTTQSSISTALTSMYSDSERSEVLYQCRFVHRMKSVCSSSSSFSSLSHTHLEWKHKFIHSSSHWFCFMILLETCAIMLRWMMYWSPQV